MSRERAKLYAAAMSAVRMAQASTGRQRPGQLPTRVRTAMPGASEGQGQALQGRGQPRWRVSRKKTRAAAASPHFQNKKGLHLELDRTGEKRWRTQLRRRWHFSAFAHIHPALESKRKVIDSAKNTCVRDSTTQEMKSRRQAAGNTVGLEGPGVVFAKTG